MSPLSVHVRSRARRLAVAHRRPEVDGEVRAHTGRAERGETLIELLATVFLLGMAVVALLGTLLAVIVSGSAHRRKVRATNDAVTIAETVDLMTYVDCATTSDYQDAWTGPNAPTNVDVAVTIRYLESASASTPTYDSACEDPGDPDEGSQQIEIVLTSAKEPTVTGRVTMVKRNDTCPDDPATVAALQLAPGDRC